MFDSTKKAESNILNQDIKLDEVYNDLCQKSVSAFHLFNQPISVDVDLEKVEDVYFEYQKRYHPDNFSEDIEKIKATQVCKKINDLCDCLYKPFCRLEIMLECAGFSKDKILTQTVQSSSMLAFMFELKDELEETHSQDDLLSLIKKVTLLIEEGEKKFQILYDQKIFEQSAGQLIEQYQELCFLYKTLVSAKQKNKKFQ
ncbi:MAG: hypothetical protein C0432_02370 [Candidatus Puniceispirillum sp.]|nr:hypothetical protein [Candidatus Pelagibacter sp.]MBA4283120.1 hypothetical protein [Candidatus Puniceispirillum sp.]